MKRLLVWVMVLLILSSTTQAYDNSGWLHEKQMMKNRIQQQGDELKGEMERDLEDQKRKMQQEAYDQRVRMDEQTRRIENETLYKLRQ